MTKLWCLTIDGFTYTGTMEPKNQEIHELYVYDNEETAKNEFALVSDAFPEVFLPDSVDDEGYILPIGESPFAISSDDHVLDIHELPGDDASDQQFLRIQLREVEVIHEGHYMDALRRM